MTSQSDGNPTPEPTPCFCRTPQDSWRVGRILATKPAVGIARPQLTVELPLGDGEPGASSTVTVASDQIEPLHDAKTLQPVDDLFLLPTQEPWAILNQIRSRYWLGKYFTNIGPITLTVNPYTVNIPLYSEANRQRYLEGATEDPHLWLVAGRVYQRVLREGNQCVLVSGESGSGKTFSIRVITNFFADVSTQHAPDGERAEARRIALMQPRVGTILEALGNAKTRRNRDSSRFAKFAKLKFNRAGYLCGCQTECHLLEVARVIQHAPGERSFHVFYQLFATQADGYQLHRCSAWLFQGCAMEIWEKDRDGRALALEQAQEVAASFNALGFDAVAVKRVYDVLAGLMHLLVTPFVPAGRSEDAGATLDTDAASWLQYVADLWEVDAAQLRAKLVTHVRKVGDDHIASPLTATEANVKRDALCKKVYHQVFDWLGARLNERCDAAETTWIGMLDIFGFEAFPENSFEQWCINYANEKLQNYYSHTTAQLLDKYTAESLTPPAGLKDIADNTESIHVIEKVIGILDDMCSNPKAHPTDNDFLQAVYQLTTPKPAHAADRPILSRPGAKLPQDRFFFQHYADVEPATYLARDFLWKNAAKVPQDVLLVLSNSANPILAGINAPPPVGSVSPTPSPTVVPAPLSRKDVRPEGQKPLAGRFRKDMTRLLNYMAEEAGLTNLHWVRCIKPNHKEGPGCFEGRLVMKQLECVIPLLEVARVSQDVWVPQATFAPMFQMLLPPAKRTGTAVEVTRHLLRLLEQEPRKRGESECFETGVHLQLGRTQVCLHKDAYRALQVARRRRLMLYLWYTAGVVAGKARRLIWRTRGAALLERAVDDESQTRDEVERLEATARVLLLDAAREHRQQAEAARAQRTAEGDRQRHLQERVEAESRAAVAEAERRWGLEQAERERRLREEFQALLEAGAQRLHAEKAELQQRLEDRQREMERQQQEATDDMRAETARLLAEAAACRMELERRLSEREAEVQRERRTAEQLAAQEAARREAEATLLATQLQLSQEALEAARLQKESEDELALRRWTAAQEQLKEAEARRLEMDAQHRKLMAEAKRLEHEYAEQQEARRREAQQSAHDARTALQAAERKAKHELDALREAEAQRRVEEAAKLQQEHEEERAALRATWEAEAARARELSAQQLELLRKQAEATAASHQHDLERERRRAAEAEEQRRAAVEAMGRQGQQELATAIAELEERYAESAARLRAELEADAQRRAAEAAETAVETARMEWQQKAEETAATFRRTLEDERAAYQKDLELRLTLRLKAETDKWLAEKEQLEYQFRQEREQWEWAATQRADQDRRAAQRLADDLTAQLEALRAQADAELRAALERQRVKLEAQRETAVRQAKESAEREAAQRLAAVERERRQEVRQLQEGLEAERQRLAEEHQRERAREASEASEQLQLAVAEARAEGQRELQRQRLQCRAEEDDLRKRFERDLQQAQQRFEEELAAEREQAALKLVDALKESERALRADLDSELDDLRQTMEAEQADAVARAAAASESELAEARLQLEEARRRIEALRRDAADHQRRVQEAAPKTDEVRLQRLRLELTARMEEERAAEVATLLKRHTEEKDLLRRDLDAAREELRRRLDQQRRDELQRQRAAHAVELERLRRDQDDALARARAQFQRAQARLQAQLEPLKALTRAMAETLTKHEAAKGRNTLFADLTAAFPDPFPVPFASEAPSPSDNLFPSSDSSEG